MAWKKKKKIEEEEPEQEPEEDEEPEVKPEKKQSKANKKPKEEDEEKRWVVADVPTQKVPMIYDKGDDKLFTVEQALVLILNNQEIILENLED